jgi:hypothetical protein
MPPLDDRMRCHVNSVYDKEVTLARVKSMDSGYPVDSVSFSDTRLQNSRWVSYGASGLGRGVAAGLYTTPHIHRDHGEVGGSSSTWEREVSGGQLGGTSAIKRAVERARDGLEIVVADSGVHKAR